MTIPENPSLAQAQALLRRLLGAGPMAVSEVSILARAEGITDRTLRRAKEALKVASSRQGFQGPWFWSLPNGGHKDVQQRGPEEALKGAGKQEERCPEGAKGPETSAGQGPEPHSLAEQLEKARLRRSIGQVQGRTPKLLLELHACYDEVIEGQAANLRIWRLADSAPRLPGQPGFREWAQILLALVKQRSEVQRMLRELDIEPRTLSELYLGLREIRRRWARYSNWYDPFDPPPADARERDRKATEQELTTVDEALRILGSLISGED